jgi:ATP/maltotriose-dependent transcriptional regulator MalT
MEATAHDDQPTVRRRERRIIERPRLIRLLEESEAKTILLLAPAGYGKTTLARQWARSLNGAIWIGATPAHRDVAHFAEDLAGGIDALGGDATKFIGEYLRARGNPQRAALDIAGALTECMSAARVQWLIVDDYHELAASPEIGQIVCALQSNVSARFLCASRVRPAWAAPRRVLYGEILEVGRESLAMDEYESTLVLGRRPELMSLVPQAEGWPAVLGLAASAGRVGPPGRRLPGALYQYLAEELYQSASESLQRQLLSLALIPEMTGEAVARTLGKDAAAVIEEARDLGFLSSTEAAELHPLIREFLLHKLVDDGGSYEAAREAVHACIAQARWERAFELILRFSLLEMIEPVLEAAYKPLVRSGRLGTLSAFAASVRVAPHFPPPAIDLIEAQVALRDGAFPLAVNLATRVRTQLPEEHALASHAHAIVGQGFFAQGELEGAEAAYRAAHETARDDQDEADALYSWSLASIQGETGDAELACRRLRERRYTSPLDLVRHGTAELARRRFQEGFAAPVNIEEPMHALSRAEDPRGRSSFAFTAGYVLGLRGDYRRALELCRIADGDVQAFDLEFARPYVDWTLAFINLGLRKFGATERSLQLVEDAARARPLGYHVLNVRVLRARLALETAQPERALEYVTPRDREVAIPSLHAEYLATRGLALAVLDRGPEALSSAREAEHLSTAVEVRTLASAVGAMVGAAEHDLAPARRLLQLASSLGTWDPVVAAARSSSALADALASIEEFRPRLADVYSASNDLALARRAGLRTRSSRAPSALLSPRELEVLGLLARGFRNRDIARALVISESTAKVHVRHILEKLGVRTRTEAASRLDLYG